MGELDRVGMAKSQLHILAGLTKLRLAACDPRLLGLPREFSHDDSAKVQAFRELIDEAQAGGHRVLVFSQFVSMLKILELKEKKKELVSAVLTEDSGGAKKLSRSDLDELFKMD